MASWHSGFSRRLARLVRPRAAGAADDIVELRRQYSAISNRFGAVPDDATFEAARIGPIDGEWARTGASPRERLILYFHGGGYIAGSPEAYRPLVARLCHFAEARAFLPAYRLAPEHPFPAALRDGVDVYRQLIGMADPRSIVLAGDGAGGGLVFAVLLAIRNAGLDMPAACVAMSPWVDLTLSGQSILANAANDTTLNWNLLFLSARHYLGKTNPGDLYASPVFASFRDFPPLMVHAGSLEILRDDASRIGDRAGEAGISVSIEIYDGMQHVFQADPALPEARVSLQRLGQFIRAKTSAVRPASVAR